MSSEIRFYNREEGKIEVEKVYGDWAIKLIYNSMLGKLLKPIFCSRFVSKFYGGKQDTLKSGKKVYPFVTKFNIDLSEYKKGSVKSSEKYFSYKSFNEFFIREFEEGKRNFEQDQKLMPAFCEARYFGVRENNNEISFPVKGKFLKPKDMLANEKWFSHFENGPLLIARLCPVDYHRYHYPDDGHTLISYPINGKFDSVNPLALKAAPQIMIENERRVAILETKNFGKLAYIEVGASMVGKIIQSHDEKSSFKRGQEKGYFLFGGSTVILLGEKGKWEPSEDILEHTQKGIETYLKLGDALATKL